jgi:hypothetical protein
MRKDNSQRIAAEQVDMLFLATPPASRYSKREEPLDTSALTIEGKHMPNQKAA